MSVVPPRAKDKLTMAAARLKRSVPSAWAEFEEAFEGVWEETTMRCVQSPPDQLHNAQGRAQQMTEVCELFASCVDEAQKLEAKLKERR